MSNEIKMPALSPTMTEGILSKWLVKIGDEIRSGDVIAEIETDKATMEVEAVDDGVVTQLVVEEGTQAVPVGTVIATISGDSGDNLVTISQNKENLQVESTITSPLIEPVAAATKRDVSV
ncbi:MAG: biotin/lipoyl-containing protein, partial [Alphaproteobacteria bacterium]